MGICVVVALIKVLYALRVAHILHSQVDPLICSPIVEPPQVLQCLSLIYAVVIYPETYIYMSHSGKVVRASPVCPRGLLSFAACRLLGMYTCN